MSKMQAPEQNASGSGRTTLLLIAGIPVTVVLVATWLWFYVASGKLDLVEVLGTANKGELLRPPRDLNDKRLTLADSTPISYPNVSSKWVFLVPIARDCDAACEQRLYLTRQIHIALGKEYNRIERIAVAQQQSVSLTAEALSDERPLPESFTAYLEKEQGDLQLINVGNKDFASLFGEYQQDASQWYLVDPNGWIMMAYSDQQTYKDVLSDLKFLLKNSNE